MKLLCSLFLSISAVPSWGNLSPWGQCEDRCAAMVSDQSDRCDNFDGSDKDRCMRYLREMYNDCVAENCGRGAPAPFGTCEDRCENMINEQENGKVFIQDFDL